MWVAAFADSHTAFKRSMPEGFSWEVIEVFSGSVLYLECLLPACCMYYPRAHDWSIHLSIAAATSPKTATSTTKAAYLHPVSSSKHAIISCIQCSAFSTLVLITACCRRATSWQAIFACVQVMRQCLALQTSKSSLQVEALGQDDRVIDMPTAQWPTNGCSANWGGCLHDGCGILQLE